MNRRIREFLLWENTSRDTIDFKKCYVDLAGDLVAGLLLSQIVYWHLPNKETGETKLRVEHEGHLWIAKGREDWWEEIRISPKQFDRASKILVDKGLIEKRTFKFEGNPTIHVRLIWENFLPALEELIYGEIDDENDNGNGDEPLSDMVFPQRVKTNLPKGEKRNSPKVKNEINLSAKSLTKNTTKNTAKNTNKDKNSNLDDDIANSTSSTEKKKKIKQSKSINQEIKQPKPINNELIESIYEEVKDIISKRSFNAVLRRVMNKYEQGKIDNFRDYFVAALANKIEELEFKRMKVEAEKELKKSASERREQKIKEYIEEQPIKATGNLIFYNWLEESNY